MKLRDCLVALPLAAVACAGGEAPPPPVAESQRAIVEHLADDALEGRMTGSPGIRKAADYIIGQLRAIGAEPLPGLDGYRQPFAYTAGVTDEGTTVAFAHDDGTPLPHPDGGGKPGARPVVLGERHGRGPAGIRRLRAVGAGDPTVFSYDSYATLDVTDKVFLVLRYFPEDAEGDLRATLARYSGLRYKALAARQRGAAGLIVAIGPRSPNAGELVPLTFDTAVADSGIVAATVDGRMAKAILESTGRSLVEVQASLGHRQSPRHRFRPAPDGRHRGEARQLGGDRAQRARLPAADRQRGGGRAVRHARRPL